MGQSIHHMFLSSVKNNAGRCALKFNGNSLTYMELNSRSNEIANYLISKNYPKNSIIGINLERGFDLIAGLIGILKAGHCYLPLDSEYPNERLNYMVKNSKSVCLITNKETKLNHTDSLYLDSFEGDTSEPVDCIGELAYTIYTSGSTGVPKGVTLGHKALVNLLRWQEKNSKGIDTLQFTPVSFDVHFQEIFSTLTQGGTLTLISEEDRLDFGKLLDICQKEKVERLFLPFVALNRLCEIAKQLDNYPAKLIDVTTAGEQLKVTDAIKDFFLKTKAKLHNHYGPSETHVVTSYTMGADIENWPMLPSIGKTIDGAQAMILDEELNEVVEGELYITGVCLAHGYIHDEQKTQERFLVINGIRAYKTGDLVRIEDDGNITYLSRLDGQIKLRGYRIELGEIEASIEKTLNLTSVVNVIRPENSDAYLVAYILGSFSEKSIRESLASKLPDYMIPRFFMQLEELPLTPSGKLDRKKLPLPEFKRPELDTDFVAPRTELEIELSQIWSEILGIKSIGINDRFFDLGGTSLSAMGLLVELKKLTKRNLTIVDLFQYASISGQVKLIQGNNNSRKKLKKKTNSTKDIAIIAMTGRFPGANSINELWSNLSTNKETIEFFSEEEVHSSVDEKLLKNKNYILATGEYADSELFDAQFFGMTPRESELMDPQQRKFLELSYEALELAGINPKVYQGDIGIFAGSANNTYQKNLQFHQAKIDSLGEFNVMLANEKDYLASRVSFKLGLTGPAISMNTGCSTSLVAIIQAVDSIRNGQSDIALAGGISINGQKKKGYLHQTDSIFSNDGHCRPFDKDASGTLFNDGAGILVLKSLEEAKIDNDNILGVIKGVGINNDGRDKMSFTAPSISGQKDSIVKAMLDANINPDDISYVEAHGTATPVGDPIEFSALKQAYQELGGTKINSCVLGSIKSNIGHLTSAAGVAGIIKTILALRHKTIPATLHFNKVNSSIDLDGSPFIISNKNVELKSDKNFAGVSSFGVGGTNAHIIIEGHVDNSVNRSSEEELYILSAKSESALLEMQKRLDVDLEKTDHANAAFSLTKRQVYSFRSSRSSLGKWSSISKKVKAKKLCFMFPGQGSQYLLMGKELMKRFPDFASTMNYCCDEISQYLNKDMRDVLFNDNEDGQNILNDTYYTQPAIFIFEYSLARLLLSFGVRADYYVGHSIGELVAATINGVFKLEDALKVIAKRSNLMAKLPEGGMLTINMKREEVEMILPENVQIAAVNGSLSTVVAGETKSLEKLAKALEKKNVVTKMLHTSHAFHSEMMRPMVGEFITFLNEIKLNLPENRIFSTVTGRSESELFTSPEYWAQHVVNPVLFANTISPLLDEETIYLEIGPRETLKSLTLKEAGLKKVKIKSLSISDRKGENEVNAFLTTLGKLWTEGFEIDFEMLFENKEVRVIPVSTYAFQGKRFWLDYPERKNKQNNIITEGTTIMNSQDGTMLRDKIVEIFEEASGIDLNDYSDDTCFFEMGMDSLFLTQISLQLKNSFKIDLSFRQLTEEFADLQSLCAYYSDKVDLGQKIEEISQTQIKTDSAPVKQTVIQENTTMQTQSPVQSQTYTAPVMQPLNASTSSEGTLGLLNQQLVLMQNQLALLSQAPLSQAITSVSSQKVNMTDAIEQKSLSESSSINLKSNDDEEEVSLKADLNNAKKAFGAIARITSEKTINDESAKAFIANFTKDYNKKTIASKNFTQDNRRQHADPRAVTGFKPENKEVVYPIVVSKSINQKLYDIDGNEYVDMLCGFGSNFFGNGNERIKQYVHAQIDQGIEIGPQHPLTADVSALINELTGNERTAFCNTGSEAVLGAMRIARTISGKKTIISFSGSYHGINDEVIIRSSKKGKSFPAAPGINHNSVSNMVVLDYGEAQSLEKIKELIKTGDVAAVMVEPVQSRRSDFHPKEFLQDLRILTEENDICLIFDEVITGFRIAQGGAQEYFGVRADLCTYGKIIGGGMPIGAVSGKAKYMDALDGGDWSYGDDSIPTVGVTYFAGTFVRHPLALAAAKGALEIIRDGGKKQLSDLNSKAQSWVEDINLFCQQVDAPVRFVNFGSLIKPKWTQGDYQYSDIFFAYLRFLGVHQYDGFPWFINLAHNDQELIFVKEVIKKTIATMQMNGMMTGKNTAINDSGILNDMNPPVIGAKLGKDEQGNAAWFIQSNTDSSKYIQLQL